MLDQQRIVAVDHICRPAADFEHRERHAVAFAPFGGWKQGRVELAVDERIGGLDPVLMLHRERHVARGDAPPRLPVDLVGGLARLLGRLGRRRQNIWIDKMPAPLPGDKKALIDELLEGEHHCAARDAELLGQDTARRQWHGCRNLPIEDRGDNRLADLSLQGLAGLG